MSAEPEFVDLADGFSVADEDWHRREMERLEREARGEPPAAEFALEVRTAREISATPEPDASAFLVGPLVVRGARTILVADTGHGKTSLSLQLVGAVLTGAEVFEHAGAGVGPVLVVDLEQGLRSIKRTLVDAGLDDREDVLYVAAPDGLALDTNERHRLELQRVIDEHRPAVVVVDPYYKAHRGEANEERGVVDLMRYLDGLRATYGFALILPAHPRKDQTGRDAPRKLKLDDVAGSGAVTRGAEVVLALERLSHGYARLRVLKDRDGDLEVGDEWRLLFTRGEGFRLDPREDEDAEELERRAIELGSDGAWRIRDEYRDALGIARAATTRLLGKLTEAGRLEHVTGPPGRAATAKVWRTRPEAGGGSGQAGGFDPETGYPPTRPDTLWGGCRAGRVDGALEEPAEGGAGRRDGGDPRSVDEGFEF